MDSPRIEDMITYNPETGEFKWLESRQGSKYGNTKWFQPPVKEISRSTYKQRQGIRIHNKHYYPHRLAWYLMKGYFPKMIDHINGDATDNRFSNLREVLSQSENMFNKKETKGYTKTKKGKYMSQIGAYGNHYYLGTFDTEEEAREAYLEAKKKYHVFYYDAEV